MPEPKAIPRKKTIWATALLSISLLGMPVVHAKATPESIQPQKIEHGNDSKATHRQHKHPFHGGQVVLDTAALLSVEPGTIFEQLKQGKTLLQIVQTSKGWSEAEYVQKLTIAVTSKIDKAVTDGKFTKEQAEQIKASLPNRIKATINRSWHNHGTPSDKGVHFNHNQINMKQDEQTSE